jgi:hypothetical protein
MERGLFSYAVSTEFVVYLKTVGEGSSTVNLTGDEGSGRIVFRRKDI